MYMILNNFVDFFNIFSGHPKINYLMKSFKAYKLLFHQLIKVLKSYALRMRKAFLAIDNILDRAMSSIVPSKISLRDIYTCKHQSLAVFGPTPNKMLKNIHSLLYRRFCKIGRRRNNNRFLGSVPLLQSFRPSRIDGSDNGFVN